MSDHTGSIRVTAIAVSAQLGGTERVLLELAERLFEFGVVLRVVTPRHGPLIQMLENIGVPAEVVPANDSFLKSSQQSGHVLSLLGGLAGLVEWSRALETHPFCRTADVVYTVSFKTHVAVALSHLRPVVWHLHEFPPPTTGLVWKLLANHVPEALVTNSKAARRAWGATVSPFWEQEIGWGRRTVPKRQLPSGSRHRAVAVLNGVNLDRFKPRARTGWIHEALGIGREHRLIGMPAVLARWKGQPEVLEAFQQVRDELPDVDLVFVGGSIYDTVAERDYGAELQAMIEDASPRVHLLPFQQDVELTYPEFDLAMHYSVRPEPFGRIILEAMASGVPVVAANEGGPPEILGDGIGPRREGGWLAEPRDPAALAQIIRSAFTLPNEILHSVGEAGRRRAEDFFSARRFAREVATVLHQTARLHGSMATAASSL